MSKFMIGDRVQIIGEPTDYDLGTVIASDGQLSGEDSSRVRWDSSGTYECLDRCTFLVFRPQANIELLLSRPTLTREDMETVAALADRLNPAEPTFAEQVDTILASVGTLLKQKNEAYGDAALNPIRVFSKASPADGLRVRIDDKLSRIARGTDAGEDTVTDLIGYLVILKISEGNK